MLLDDTADMSLVVQNDYLNKYELLFENCPIGLFSLNQTGLIQRVNEAGAKLLGVEKEGLIHKNFTRYVSPDSQQEFTHYRKRLLKKAVTQTGEFKLLQRHKPILHAQLVSHASVNQQTGTVELLMMVSATDYRKRSDYPSYQQQIDSFHTMGMSANVIANDLNGPLAIIANYIYGCINRLESGDYKVPNLLQAMKQAEQELHRTGEIIVRMKNFSCRDIFKYDTVCINSVIEEITILINAEILDYPVKIIFRPMKGLPKVKLDKVYIQQAILNVARNAVEAMHEANMEDPKLIIEINRPSKEIIEVILMDNGPAFKPDSLHKLFDPHYTTKSYGIGMGLIVSRVIIESHGGTLSAKLNPTRGACFAMTLPLHPEGK